MNSLPGLALSCDPPPLGISASQVAGITGMSTAVKSFLECILSIVVAMLLTIWILLFSIRNVDFYSGRKFIYRWKTWSVQVFLKLRICAALSILKS
jgi:hypothetical protein